MGVPGNCREICEYSLTLITQFWKCSEKYMSIVLRNTFSFQYINISSRLVPNRQPGNSASTVWFQMSLQIWQYDIKTSFCAKFWQHFTNLTVKTSFKLQAKNVLSQLCGGYNWHNQYTKHYLYVTIYSEVDCTVLQCIKTNSKLIHDKLCLFLLLNDCWKK